MTVEQSTLQQNNSKRGRDEISQTYATVKEICGIDDQRVIDEAISACRTKDGSFRVEDVVSMLIQDETVRKRQQQVRSSKNTKSVSFQDNQTQHPSVETVKRPQQETTLKKNNGVIDLTGEHDQQDINKAITASLHDSQGILGGQVTREEQDISRVLEASIAESKAGTKRKRGELWFVDPLNPNERKRHDSWPVGLKNIGNTCWFSAVIQSLFYLPKLRSLVLNFRNPSDASGSIYERRNLRFMKELSMLFAFLVGSKRKYVDPSKAVDILKEAFSSPPGSTDCQQDVSEFQHKLLEWLEDAFKWDRATNTPATSPTAPAAPGGDFKNPVTELFYGQYTAEGEREGEKFIRQEMFGQFPLQVNGFRDIHESLEATTMDDQIEAVNKTAACQKSGQELWFTHLPPVLTFELCRFQFNQQLGRPEKIHNKLEFPRVIYFDRYLESNKAVTRQRRAESRKLREQLKGVQARLDRFMNYGSGSKRCPLHDVLQYTLEFAESKPPSSPWPPSTPTPSDVEMESPKSSLNMSRTSLESTAPGSMHDASEASCTPTSSASCGDVSATPITPPVIDSFLGAGEMYPSPKQITDTELSVLQSCLQRWREEVENDVKELQCTISKLENMLDKMYSDEVMQRHPYHLHAVLVHEGQAASGHYWAFVYDQSRCLWLKFNDITVLESSWEEIEKESIGGYHNASAYCLMYIDRGRIQEAADRVEASASDPCPSTVDSLPAALHDLVAADNKAFEQELEDWDADQARKSSKDVEVTVSLPLKPVSSSSHCTLQPQLGLAVVHAQVAFKDTVRAVEQVVDLISAGHIQQALTQAASSELKRLQVIAEEVPNKLPHEDPRLHHIGVYVICNRANPLVQNMIIYEQFTYMNILDKDPRIKELRLASVDKIRLLKSDNNKMAAVVEDYERWHMRYHHYRQAAYMLVRGLHSYYQDRFMEALPYFHHSWLHNRLIGLTKMENLIGIDNRLICYFRRKCLEKVNMEAMQQFESDADVGDALTLMVNQILPSLVFLSQSDEAADISTMEELRSKWCAFLEKELSESKIEKLQDFLTKIFENLSEVQLQEPKAVKVADMIKLHLDYSQVIKKAQEMGDTEQALGPE